MGNNVNIIKGMVLGLLVLGCQLSAWSRTKTESLSDNITQIVNYTPFAVSYRPGSSKIEMKGPDKVIDAIEIKQSGRTLTINYNGERLNKGQEAEITVGGEIINSFRLYGSGDITASNLEGSGITLQVYGSGDIRVGDLVGSKIRLDLYGSGDIRVGNADCSSLLVVCNGSGDIELRNADAVVSELMQQGSGDVMVKRIDCTSLKATNNGSGDLKVSGETVSAVYIINGSGDIDSSGMKTGRVTKIVQGTGSIK